MSQMVRGRSLRSALCSDLNSNQPVTTASALRNCSSCAVTCDSGDDACDEQYAGMSAYPFEGRCPAKAPVPVSCGEA